MEENQYLLEMKGICKSFPRVIANDHIDLEIHKGRVHVYNLIRRKTAVFLKI